MTETPVEPDPEVAAVAAVAREYGHHLGRMRYAGVTADHERRSITVYRVPDASFDDALRGLLSRDVTLHIAEAPHSRDDLLVARERVWALADSLSITSVGIPADGSRLNVVADAPAHEVQAALDRVVPGLATATSGNVPAR
jgi:hypothetical protein